MIIGISGKKQVGKDTVATIIQYLTSNYTPTHTYEEFWKSIKRRNDYPAFLAWQNKKFADGIKDIVCLIIGCTREQLEDEEFKNTVLSEEWCQYDETTIKNWLLKSYSMKELESDKSIFLDNYKNSPVGITKMTPRIFLQLLGTECGREIIHPNIWVNMLMKDYKLKHFRTVKYLGDFDRHESIYPNWVISDVRFPNEIQAIRKEKGILIKINRITGLVDTHKSETELDNYTQWDYVIDNNDTIFALEKKVETILIREKIIRNEGK